MYFDQIVEHLIGNYLNFDKKFEKTFFFGVIASCHYCTSFILSMVPYKFCETFEVA